MGEGVRGHGVSEHHGFTLKPMGQTQGGREPLLLMGANTHYMLDSALGTLHSGVAKLKNLTSFMETCSPISDSWFLLSNLLGVSQCFTDAVGALLASSEHLVFQYIARVGVL